MAGGGVISSRSIQVNGLDVHYFTGGEGEPLVIIHGGAEGAVSWMKSATELSKYYRVYVPDLPGFGHSKPISEEFRFSDYVSFIDSFSKSLGLGRYNLVGHSLGGGIAIHFALTFPEKITKLVLVSSLGLGKELGLWVRVLTAPAFIRTAGQAAVAVFRAFKYLVKLIYAPFEFFSPVTRLGMSIGKNVMSRASQSASISQLSHLLMPTLLVWGARDLVVPVANGYSARFLIPDCRLHVFAHCGHSVYREESAEFSRLVAGFLG